MPHTFSVAQIQALRSLYGAALTLVRNASPPAIPGDAKAPRMIEGDDYVRLIQALEHVQLTMKGSSSNAQHDPKPLHN